VSSSLKLAWTAPPECPQGWAVQQEVSRLLGPNPEMSQTIRISGTLVVEGPGRHRLVLTTVVNGSIGERTLVGGSCETLSDAAALTIALILNPDFRPPEPEHPPERVPRQQRFAKTLPPASTSDDLSPPPPQARPSGTPWTLWVLPQFGVEFGSLSEPTTELGLGLALRKGAAHAELGVDVAPFVHVDSPGHEGAGATAWKLTMTSLVCYDVTTTAWRVAPCAGLSFRRVEGKGLGVVEPRKDVIHWLSPAAGLTVTRVVRRNLGLRLEGLAFVSPRRPSASLESGESIYRPELLGLRALVGVEVQAF
jgi:hypothetical protein